MQKLWFATITQSTQPVAQEPEELVELVEFVELVELPVDSPPVPFPVVELLALLLGTQ